MQAYGVGYGEPAARLLRDLVAEAKADDPLAPVTIVVPTDSVGTSTRRALAAGRYGAVGRGHGIAGLYLLTIHRLGELLGAPRLAAAGRRPATTPVLAAASTRSRSASPWSPAGARGRPGLVRARRGASGDGGGPGSSPTSRLATLAATV
jgi:ATP-dependent helicase/nuclease subunit B